MRTVAFIGRIWNSCERKVLSTVPRSSSKLLYTDLKV